MNKISNYLRIFENLSNESVSETINPFFFCLHHEFASILTVAIKRLSFAHRLNVLQNASILICVFFFC